MQAFAVKVIWKNGKEDFLCHGFTKNVMAFTNRHAAKEFADFMREGMDEVQSINVVRYNGKGKGNDRTRPEKN